MRILELMTQEFELYFGISKNGSPILQSRFQFGLGCSKFSDLLSVSWWNKDFVRWLARFQEEFGPTRSGYGSHNGIRFGLWISMIMCTAFLSCSHLHVAFFFLVSKLNFQVVTNGFKNKLRLLGFFFLQKVTDLVSRKIPLWCK